MDFNCHEDAQQKGQAADLTIMRMQCHSPMKYTKYNIVKLFNCFYVQWF